MAARAAVRGSMHVYDMESNFQGGWALVAEQLPYAVGAARSIVLDKMLGREDAKIASPLPSPARVALKTVAWPSA